MLKIKIVKIWERERQRERVQNRERVSEIVDKRDVVRNTNLDRQIDR